MARISIHDLEYSYKQYVNPIFKNVNLNIDTTWKLGLIGRNGRGKTTLLKLLNGDLHPDRGNISKSVDTEIFPYDYNAQYVITLDLMLENMGGLKSIEREMEQLEQTIGAEEMKRYGELLTEYLDKDGYSAESRIKKELALLELPEELLYREFASLSGGEQTKILIVTLFLRSNCFVLLDEPTNHLDIEGKRCIRDYLKRKQGFILVSHDRELLDSVTDHIISINKNDISVEQGNYSTWRHNVELTEAYELRTRERLTREIDALEKSAQNSRKWSGIVEKTRNPFATHARGYDSRSASLMRRAKKSEEKIRNNIDEKRTLLRNYEQIPDLKLEQDKINGNLVALNNISFDYGMKPVIENFSLDIQSGDILWVKGNNGTGKSTLLRLIAGHILPKEGTIYRLGNLTISEAFQHCLYTSGWAYDFFATKEEMAKCRSICAYFDIGAEHLSRPIETFSSGELKKFDIARAISTKNQLLILDEPLNFMDIYFREQLERAILEFAPTLVFVEHDEWFGNSVANKIVEL